MTKPALTAPPQDRQLADGADEIERLAQDGWLTDTEPRPVRLVLSHTDAVQPRNGAHTGEPGLAPAEQVGQR
ncbi:hypothetical protein [Streptomyces albicerus]|uniref:hypothetical protein n=1 Tax=Streptomyces albicerus TaxID=2569859 RepID=UPI001788BBF6|nr:hypothetical protein [Streptomyces albicerus]